MAASCVCCRRVVLRGDRGRGRGGVGSGRGHAALAEPGDPAHRRRAHPEGCWHSAARCSTIVGNRGPGPAELFPGWPDTSDCDHDGDPDNDRIASQRIFNDSNENGTFERGVNSAASTQVIGCFIFHPEHDHWHFEEFARYGWAGPSGHGWRPRRRSRSASGTRHVRRAPRVALLAHYGECTGRHQGLSVGWSDLYQSNLSGQELDIRGLPAGRYCLRNVADPAARRRVGRDRQRSLRWCRSGADGTDLDRRCSGAPR